MKTTSYLVAGLLLLLTISALHCSKEAFNPLPTDDPLIVVTHPQDTVTCGSKHVLYNNSSDKDTIRVEVRAIDKCEGGVRSSVRRIGIDDRSRDRSIYILENSWSVTTFTVAPGEQIVLECNGWEGWGCPYTLVTN
ncbi:MAG TPA: hypothetical protein PKD70_10765 [Saprospiraceae bacterium]|nr:hypothetical protein [Saprospiraceae bacterium]HMP14353.1 hypothetical protein [Saprospiraceae bacterium]